MILNLAKIPNLLWMLVSLYTLYMHTKFEVNRCGFGGVIKEKCRKWGFPC